MYQVVSGDVEDLGRRLGLEELLDEGVLTSIVSTQTLADIQNKIVVRRAAAHCGFSSSVPPTRP